MSNTKKSPSKLLTQCLIVFGSICVVMYVMGLWETFGIIGFFLTALIMTVMITVLFL